MMEGVVSDLAPETTTTNSRREKSEDTISLWDTAIKTCPGRVYITTVGGRVGISTREVQLGDEIVVFQGATEAMFVLRSAESLDTYEFAGEAYVDGLTGLDETLVETACTEEFIIL